MAIYVFNNLFTYLTILKPTWGSGMIEVVQRDSVALRP